LLDRLAGAGGIDAGSNPAAFLKLKTPVKEELMIKKIFWLFLMLSLVLSACGKRDEPVERTASPDIPRVAATSTIPAVIGPGPTFTLPDQLLSMSSTSEAIRLKMLQSALTWKTIWLDGVIYDSLDSNGNPQGGTRQQVWIDQPTARFRFLSGPVDGGAATRFKVSDGTSILDMDLSTGATQLSAMPAGVAGQFAAQPAAGIASPDPLWGQIGERLAEMAFPSDYAQNDGTYKPLAIETVSGRPALVMEWTYIQNSLPSWRLWLDVHTATILKMQSFDKGGGTQVQSEYIVNQVQYDLPNLPDDLFSLTPASLPAFSDASGSPLVSVIPGPAVQAGTDPSGEVYFFILAPGDDANGARLVRLPGSCVIGLQACPALEQVPLPGLTYANNGATMAWSPDATKAAFVTDVTEGPARLFVSAMPTPSWKQVAAFATIDMPAWSGDGKWISFRVQDLQGGQDFYVVHPDGSGLKNLTATARLPSADRPFNVDGWIGDNLIVHSARPGHATQVFLLRADDDQVTALFNSVATTKVSYSPSPDGSRLAFDEYDENSQSDSLRIIATDGSALRVLASFKASISSVSWSPDGTRLAFAVFGNDNPPHSDVYVINQDGGGLEQVYAGASIISLTFSPDGKFLLLGSMEQGRVYVADLSNLESHLLQAPGLSLTDWWREPAWVR
jgi:hypothetical protein